MKTVRFLRFGRAQRGLAALSGAACAALERQYKNTNGSAVIEAALALPVFLIFVLGVMMIGHAITVRDIMQNALEKGARYAMMNPAVSDAAITSEITGSVVMMKAEYFTFNISSGNSAMKTKTISVSYKYKFLPGFFGLAPDAIKSEITFPVTQ